MDLLHEQREGGSNTLLIDGSNLGLNVQPSNVYVILIQNGVL